MKKKLLIIGSSSVHVYNYIALIQDYFDEILLITNEKRAQSDIDTVVINFHLNLKTFSAIRTVAAVAQEFNPSHIHIHQANSYGLIGVLGLRKCSAPIVLSAWGSDILVSPKKSIIHKKMLEYILNRIDIVTSDSLHMANEIKLYNANIHVALANFGIEIPEDRIEKENIIYSNRLHNDLYNIDKIIHAFYKFSLLNKEWKLIIGAIGSNTEKLKKIVHEFGLDDKVEFIGWVDTKLNNEIYKKAKIYISIPDSDATSISLLEAVANDCICFVSNLPSNCEHILDGINGFIEANKNAIDLQKFEKINLNLLSDVNRIRKYSYEKSTNREVFLNIYNQLQGV